MDDKWVCYDCSKIINCKYFKWVNIINGFYTNPNRVITECKHYDRERPEK